jgi:hypothetical protein
MTRYGITKKSLGISGHGLRTVFSEMPDLFDDSEVDRVSFGGSAKMNYLHQ